MTQPAAGAEKGGVEGGAPAPQETLWGAQSWGQVARSVALLAALFALIIILALIFKRNGILFESSYFKISFAGKEQNAAIRRVTYGTNGLRLTLSDGGVVGDALIPASQPWVPAGIPIRSGDHIFLQASGLVNLSIPNTIRLNNEPEQYGDYPTYMVTPYGRNVGPGTGGYRVTDDWRDPVKLMPGARLGTLVGTVSTGSQRPQLVPRPRLMFSLDQARDGFKYTGPEGCLYLSVNDLVVDPTARSRDVYLLRENSQGQRFDEAQQLERFGQAYSTRSDEKARWWIEWATRRWTEAARREYHHYWFEDNVGYLLASVLVRPENPGEASRHQCSDQN